MWHLLKRLIPAALLFGAGWQLARHDIAVGTWFPAILLAAVGGFLAAVIAVIDGIASALNGEED